MKQVTAKTKKRFGVLACALVFTIAFGIVSLAQEYDFELVTDSTEYTTSSEITITLRNTGAMPLDFIHMGFEWWIYSAESQDPVYTGTLPSNLRSFIDVNEDGYWRWKITNEVRDALIDADVYGYGRYRVEVQIDLTSYASDTQSGVYGYSNEFTITQAQYEFDVEAGHDSYESGEDVDIAITNTGTKPADIVADQVRWLIINDRSRIVYNDALSTLASSLPPGDEVVVTWDTKDNLGEFVPPGDGYFARVVRYEEGEPYSIAWDSPPFSILPAGARSVDLSVTTDSNSYELGSVVTISLENRGDGGINLSGSDWRWQILCWSDPSLGTIYEDVLDESLVGDDMIAAGEGVSWEWDTQIDTLADIQPDYYYFVQVFFDIGSESSWDSPVFALTYEFPFDIDEAIEDEKRESADEVLNLPETEVERPDSLDTDVEAPDSMKKFDPGPSPFNP
jgi:hypothetical protein